MDAEALKLLTPLLPLGTALYHSSRAVVTYKVHRINFSGKELVERGVLEAPEYGIPRIGFAEIELRNRSFRHLSDVVALYDEVDKNWFAEVVRTTTLPKENIDLTHSNETLKIEVKDYPRGETIAVRLIHRGYIGLRSCDVRGGSSRFRMAEAGEHRLSFIVTFVFSLVVMVALYGLLSSNEGPQPASLPKDPVAAAEKLSAGEPDGNAATRPRPGVTQE